jgi:hypothetical protein
LSNVTATPVTGLAPVLPTTRAGLSAAPGPACTSMDGPAVRPTSSATRTRACLVIGAVPRALKTAFTVPAEPGFAVASAFT